MSPVFETSEESSVAEQFDRLAKQWKAATALLSSSTAILDHAAYRAIIALGEPVVPYLLRDLERQPAHWFEALHAITGENPVPREHWGNLEAMKEDWIAWGRQHGSI